MGKPVGSSRYVGSSCSAAKAAAAACRPLLHAVDERGSERRRDAGETGDAVLARGADCGDLVDIPVLPPPLTRAGGGRLTLFSRYVDVENVRVCRVGGMSAAQADLVRASVCGRVRRWRSDMAATSGGQKDGTRGGAGKDDERGCVTRYETHKKLRRPSTDRRSSIARARQQSREGEAGRYCTLHPLDPITSQSAYHPSFHSATSHLHSPKPPTTDTWMYVEPLSELPSKP